MHFVGIKGIAMANLAIMVNQEGIEVTGTDVEEEFVTDAFLRRAGISWNVGFSPRNIPDACDLVVVTGAHGGMTNPEAQAAKERGFRVVTQAQALGLFMEGFRGISVCGCHGKTTTSAMLATVLDRSGKHPSFLVGSATIAALQQAARFDGRGEFFVAEADEYLSCPMTDRTPKFLYQHPEIIIATNIEYDHPDAYASLDDIKKAYKTFFQSVPSGGMLFGCSESPEILSLFHSLSGYPQTTYGIEHSDSVRVSNVRLLEGETAFSVTKGKTSEDFRLRVPGMHNVLNATAVVAVGLHLDLSLVDIKRGLFDYTGTTRRFEFIAECNGRLLYDDYAHHPTEIRSTLQAARSWFGKRRIVCIFQPHTYSRTKALFTEFVQAFSSADVVILTDIYASKREGKDTSVSSALLVQEMKIVHPNVLLISDKKDVPSFLATYTKSSDVVITMGAGDIYHLHPRILEEIQHHG